jgi:hypothetical protein
MKGMHMNIKPLLIALSISPVALSAADIQNDSTDPSPLLKIIKKSPNRYNADINVVVKDYVSVLKSIDNVNTFIKSFQVEIYDLVDAGENQKAQALYNFAIETLDPLFERMDDTERWRSGEETLASIEKYMDDHEQLMQD